jgi:hypothetical protein
MSVEKAAKMAGEWWAKRLSDKYANKRTAIASAVESRVAQTLNGAAYWDWNGQRKAGSGKPAPSVSVICDYEPLALLASAVQEVFGDELTSFQLFTSLQDLFPRKHDLVVTRDRLRPKEGYGNWTPDILVSD